MAESFLTLSPDDRREALGVIASASGRPAHIVEKDVWVVWTLAALFESPFSAHLVFKGGTSLSKAYRAIRRFSEDIDVTYDIRAFAPDLVAHSGDEALPPSGSQERKWTKAIRARLPEWVSETALPYLRERTATSAWRAEVRAAGDSLHVNYEPHAPGYGYTAPRIVVEFGARSTGEPATVRPIVCDAADFQPDLIFPTASPRVMKVERTFWEKATAVHVFCHNGNIKDGRARHWYDLAKLDTAGYADAALRDRALAHAVARHKTWFFEARDREGAAIDYFAAVNGNLTLMPKGAALRALVADYEKMVVDGLLLDGAEAFTSIIERCRTLQHRANEAIAA